MCMTVFYTQARWATLAGATIFVLAAITDWLDGYLARRVIYRLDFLSSWAIILWVRLWIMKPDIMCRYFVADVFVSV